MPCAVVAVSKSEENEQKKSTHLSYPSMSDTLGQRSQLGIGQIGDTAHNELVTSTLKLEKKGWKSLLIQIDCTSMEYSWVVGSPEQAAGAHLFHIGT